MEERTFNFKVGQLVKWNDPAINDYPKDERKFRKKLVFMIDEIQTPEDDSTIYEDTIINIHAIGCGTEAEVYPTELVIAPSVWIVRTDCIFDFEDMNKTVKVFRKREDAQEHFNALVEQERKVAEDNEWEIESDTDDYFEAYPDGYYGTSHSVVSLERVPIY